MALAIAICHRRAPDAPLACLCCVGPRRADQSIMIQPYDPDRPSLYEQEREVLRVANRGADKKWRPQ